MEDNAAPDCMEVDPASGQSSMEFVNTEPPVAAPADAVAPEPMLLCTVGYGQRSIDALLALLRAHRIRCVVDVRSAPYSRFKPEYSREPLEAALAREGVRYRFLGDTLGGQPPAPECYSEGKVDYDKIRVQAFFRAGLEQLRDVLREERRIALLCSEARPEACHRSKLIGEAVAAWAEPIRHIDADGELRTQAEVIDRLTGGQLELFGPPSFTSRKRYDRTTPG